LVRWRRGPGQPLPRRNVGWVCFCPFPDGDPLVVGWLKALRQPLAGLGWHEGGNLKIEVRRSQGDDARSRAYAKEFVETQPDAILAHGRRIPAAHSGGDRLRARRATLGLRRNKHWFATKRRSMPQSKSSRELPMAASSFRLKRSLRSIGHILSHRPRESGYLSYTIMRIS
jgi:hypothetical protein